LLELKMIAETLMFQLTVYAPNGECQKFCVEGHTVSLKVGGSYGGPEGIDRGVVGEQES
jgi:hypothetical protein